MNVYFIPQTLLSAAFLRAVLLGFAAGGVYDGLPDGLAGLFHLVGVMDGRGRSGIITALGLMVHLVGSVGVGGLPAAGAGGVISAVIGGIPLGFRGAFR